MTWVLIAIAAISIWVVSFFRVLYSACVPARPGFLSNGLGKSGRRRNVLLVVAHPDDESMFFAPTILFLISEGHNVHILCLSTGNAEGKGNVRQEEFYRACATLKVPLQQVKILDHPNLQDGFDKPWDRQLVAKVLKEEVKKGVIDSLITFDSFGVSGHPNHRDVHHGICDKWLIEGGEGLKRVAPHRDEEISEGRNKCLERLFSEGEIAEVRQQYGDFSIACNKFSSWQSNRDRYSMEPQTWWANYGAGAPKIAALADRLLNQPASSSSCERNWSTFSYILNVKRNRTKANRAEDLVFIHSNLRLLSRREQSYRDGPSKCWDMVAEESNLEFPIDIDLEELSLNDPVVERMLLIADDENQEVDPDMPPLEDA